MEIPKKIKDDIWEYCRLNDIPNIDDFILKMIKQGFNVEKFGATPFDVEPEIKEVEKIVEVVKEIPVEKIVEVVKEVPVEKIIEKEIYITDDEQVNELKQKLIDSQKDSSKYLSAWEEKLGEVERLKKEVSKSQDGFVGVTREYDKLVKEKTKLEEEIGRLKEELEEEKKKVNKVDDKDIYGENNKGYLGSNISDLWRKRRS